VPKCVSLYVTAAAMQQSVCVCVLPKNHVRSQIFTEKEIKTEGQGRGDRDTSRFPGQTVHPQFFSTEIIKHEEIGGVHVRTQQTPSTGWGSDMGWPWLVGSIKS